MNESNFSFMGLKVIPSRFARNPDAIYVIGEDAQREIGKLLGLAGWPNYLEKRQADEPAE